MDETKISTRADISDSDKWDLTHLFADVGKWRRILHGCSGRIQSFRIGRAE
jgi:hypothetical protein